MIHQMPSDIFVITFGFECSAHTKDNVTGSQKNIVPTEQPTQQAKFLYTIL